MLSPIATGRPPSTCRTKTRVAPVGPAAYARRVPSGWRKGGVDLHAGVVGDRRGGRDGDGRRRGATEHGPANQRDEDREQSARRLASRAAAHPRQRHGRGRGRLGCASASSRRSASASGSSCGDQLVGALGAIGRPLREAAHHHASSAGGMPARCASPASAPAVTCAASICCGVVPVNGGCAGQQLVAHHAEGVDVHPVVHVRIGGRLLRRHVGRRAQRHARGGELLRGRWPRSPPWPRRSP